MLETEDNILDLPKNLQRSGQITKNEGLFRKGLILRRAQAVGQQLMSNSYRAQDNIPVIRK